MDFAKVSGIVLTMLLPTLLVWAGLNATRCFRAVRRLVGARGVAAIPQPTHAPIEQLAADLQRLLQQHETQRRSTVHAMRVRRLAALEAAIADCATEAASALGVPCPEGRRPGGMAKRELRRLLRALADAGLVLPRSNSLLGAD